MVEPILVHLPTLPVQHRGIVGPYGMKSGFCSAPSPCDTRRWRCWQGWSMGFSGLGKRHALSSWNLTYSARVPEDWGPGHFSTCHTQAPQSCQLRVDEGIYTTERLGPTEPPRKRQPRIRVGSTLPEFTRFGRRATGVPRRQWFRGQPSWSRPRQPAPSKTARS